MDASVPPPMETSASASAWPEMSLNACRVLGVLIEKAKTTPDAYPLTLNGLIAGCNQKSNRDPVLQLEDHDVEAAIEELKRLGYAQQIMGSGRTDKYRHVCYEAWRVDKVELAILGELLLRGAQTEGELRGRASRMEPIADLDSLREHLQRLSARGLVVFLTPESQRRGTTVTHGFQSMEAQRRQIAALPASELQSASPSRTSPAASPPWLERLDRLEQEVAGLREEVSRLRADLEKRATS